MSPPSVQLIFVFSAIIAILVYVIGGVVYQRVVMHQRGWRQLPNYVLWASIATFLKDIVIISTSSCLRCLPGGRSRRWLGGSRQGGSLPYNGLNGSPTANGNGSSGLGRGGRGHSSSDDENRLIDQLDEEWDD
jgi:cation-dependent mannose-6-phosphate receptor